MKWRLDDGQIEVVDDVVAEALRRKTPGQRLRMVTDLWRFMRTWVRAAVRSQHPDWDESAVEQEANRRFSSGAT